MKQPFVFRALLCLGIAVIFGSGLQAHAQINVISVDCTPFVSPGLTSFGQSNTMGMSLQQVDTGGLFNVTEVTPQAFRALTAAQLAAYDLIAINNNPNRISDNCVPGSPGLGTAWHGVIGINSGGRVHLNSHDAARFKIIVPPSSTPFGAAGGPCPGCEPFAADDLVRQGALWAGGGTRTGLLMFNDSARFFTVGGVGWGNPELNLPAAWGITDADQSAGGFADGGYTDILPAFAGHPIYAGLTDARLAPNSVASFAANIVDDSFHSIFGSFNGAIFTPTELLINVGVVDVGGFNATYGFGSFVPPIGPNGLAISLVRDEATGACCTNGPGTASDCIVTDQADCLANHKLYLGDGVPCTDMLDCEELLVTYESISADRVSEGVLVRWTTITEVDTVGFRLLRESLGVRTKSLDVVASMIHSAGHGMTGASYRFLDDSKAGASAVQYYLEDLDIYGKVTRHGPIAVTETPAMWTRGVGRAESKR